MISNLNDIGVLNRKYTSSYYSDNPLYGLLIGSDEYDPDIEEIIIILNLFGYQEIRTIVGIIMEDEYDSNIIKYL